jgi:hypothetical protein
MRPLAQSLGLAAAVLVAVPAAPATPASAVPRDPAPSWAPSYITAPRHSAARPRHEALAPRVAPRATSPVRDDVIVYTAASSAGVGVYLRHVTTARTETVLLPAGPTVDYQDPVLSPDGTQVAYARGDLAVSPAHYQIYVVSVTGTAAASLRPSAREQCAPDWSPTAPNRVLYTEDCDPSGSPSLVAVDAATHVATTLPIPGAAVARYSADGSQIAYVAVTGGTGYLAVASADGSRAAPHLSVQGTYPSLSPDGTRLLFEYQKSDANGPLQASGVGTVRTDGTVPVNLAAAASTRLDATAPSFSADGSEVYYSAAAYDPGTDAVYGFYDVYAADPSGTYVSDITRSGDVDEVPARFTSTGTPAAAPPTSFVPVAPQRLLDTRREGAACGRLGAGAVCSLQVSAAGSPVPGPGVAKAVVLNVTGVGATANTYLSVYPSAGVATPLPLVSSLNLTAGLTAAVLVQVRVGAGDRVLFYNASGSTHLVVDVAGYFVTEDGSGRFHPTNPTRVVDSRIGAGCAAALGPDRACSFDVRAAPSPVPASARPTAVVLNLTGVGATASTYLTAYPGGTVPPTASNVNVGVGAVRANLVTVKVGDDGRVVLRNAAGSTHVVVDVAGWYDDSGYGSAFHPLGTPLRVLDTRYGLKTALGATTPVASRGTIGVRAVGTLTTAYGSTRIPTGATALVTGLTGTAATASTYLTAFPGDAATPPTASNLNLAPGLTVPNLAIVRVPRSGLVEVYNGAGTTHVLSDVFGYYG